MRREIPPSRCPSNSSSVFLAACCCLGGRPFGSTSDGLGWATACIVRRGSSRAPVRRRCNSQPVGGTELDVLSRCWYGRSIRWVDGERDLVERCGNVGNGAFRRGRRGALGGVGK